MIDHAKRIAVNQRIDEMERRVNPLIIVIVVCLLAITVDGLLDVYAAHKNSDQIQAASVFASCLNGQRIEIGDALAICKVTNFKLVEGIK